jgi:hypothetical protein
VDGDARQPIQTARVERNVTAARELQPSVRARVGDDRVVDASDVTANAALEQLVLRCVERGSSSRRSLLSPGASVAERRVDDEACSTRAVRDGARRS